MKLEQTSTIAAECELREHITISCNVNNAWQKPAAII